MYFIWNNFGQSIWGNEICVINLLYWTIQWNLNYFLRRMAFNWTWKLGRRRLVKHVFCISWKCAQDLSFHYTSKSDLNWEMLPSCPLSVSRKQGLGWFYWQKLEVTRFVSHINKLLARSVRNYWLEILNKLIFPACRFASRQIAIIEWFYLSHLTLDNRED